MTETANICASTSIAGDRCELAPGHEGNHRHLYGTGLVVWSTVPAYSFTPGCNHVRYEPMCGDCCCVSMVEQELVEAHKAHVETTKRLSEANARLDARALECEQLRADLKTAIAAAIDSANEHRNNLRKALIKIVIARRAECQRNQVNSDGQQHLWEARAAEALTIEHLLEVALV